MTETLMGTINNRKPKSEMSASELYESAAHELILSKQFFARLAFMAQKIYTTDTKQLPTASVGITTTGIKLHINSDWIKLNHSINRQIIEHELLHLLFDHHTKTKEQRGADRQKWGIATDIAINQFIENLPPTFKFKNEETGEIEDRATACLENMQKQLPNLLPKESARYYYEKLVEAYGENSSPGDPTGGTGMYELDEKGEGGSEASDLTEDQQANIMARTLQHLKGCTNGLDGFLSNLIETYGETKVDWKSHIRNFVSNSEEIRTEETRTRRNRRYGITYAGSKTEPLVHVVVCQDSSGSVSDEQYAAFYDNLDRIYQTGNVSITVIQADSHVQDIQKYKKGMSRTRKGYGGTSYQPAISKAVELGADCIIYMGDLDSADTPVKPNVPVLWAVVGSMSQNPFSFGRFVKIDL